MLAFALELESIGIKVNVCRETLRDLKTDSFVGPSDEGYRFVVHLLFCIDVWPTPLPCVNKAKRNSLPLYTELCSVCQQVMW
jgi:hypothetical protein